MAEILICIFARFLIWLILLLVSLLFETPLIVMTAFFRRGAFLQNVRSGYAAVVQFCDDWLALVC